MKKLLIAIMLISGVAQAQHYTITATNTASMVAVPATQYYTEITWTNLLAVTNGQYIVQTNASPLTYWAITSGTASNQPAFTSGTSNIVGEVYWLQMPTATLRKNAILFGGTNDVVYYTTDGTDATTSGSILDKVRPARALPGNQNSISIIPYTNSATVAVELEY